MTAEKPISIIFDQHNQSLDKVGKKSLQYVAALIASISTLCTGTAIAWTSQISVGLLNGDLGFKITEEELGWVGSLMPLGAAFLSVASGTLSDYLGRKMYMIYLVVPMVTGWILLIFANNVTMLYLGRFITGMVAGSYCVMSPMYSHEIAQKDIRGTLGSFTQMMISVGILLSAIISKYTSIETFTIICAVIPIIFAIAFMFMPETPVYLLKSNREEAARKALVRLRGNNFDIDSEIEIIKHSLKEKSGIDIEVIKKSFRKTATRRACIIAAGLMAFRVLCGIDAVTAFASLIFKEAGVAVDEQTCTIILTSLQTASGIFQSAVVDKLGRKILLLISSTVMSLCLVLVGLSILLRKRDILADNFLLYVPLVALCIFLVGYSLGLGPIPWMITGEIFPQEIKSIASSIASFISWMLTFGVIKIFLIMTGNWGQDVTFLIFGGITGLAVLFVWTFVHETKGKTFAQIQEELETK